YSECAGSVARRCYGGPRKRRESPRDRAIWKRRDRWFDSMAGHDRSQNADRGVPEAFRLASVCMKIWHPYTQEAVEPEPLEIARGEGAYLYTRDGRRLLDAISSWWVNLHGHGHPLIAEAIAIQARKLEQVIFAGFTHAPAEELASALGHIMP